MRFVNDAVEFISGVHAAVPEIEFHNVGRQSVSPVLCASFPDRVDCELAVRLYPCPFGVNLEVPQDIVNHLPVLPLFSCLPESSPFLLDRLRLSNQTILTQYP